MEAELVPRLQLMYFIESRPKGDDMRFFLSIGLRNVGGLLLEKPAVAVDVLIDNFSTTANTMDGHAWWTRPSEEWQPIGLDRTQKFHTWADSRAVIYPGTERCVISELQFYAGDRSIGLRTARVEVFVYGVRFQGCAILELGEHECISMLQKSKLEPAECGSISGVVDLEEIDLARYASAPVVGGGMVANARMVS